MGSHVTAPGEQLGVRCLAQGHLSRGIEGGTWQYGLASVSSYSVFRVKSERRHYCLLLVCSATALANRDTHGPAVYGTRVLAFPASN